MKSVTWMVILGILCGTTWAQPQCWEDFRREKGSVQERKYQQLLREHGDDAGLKTFQDRVKLLDDVSREIIARFEKTREYALSGLLADTMEIIPAEREISDTVLRSPREIYAAYVDSFSSPLSRPALSAADFEDLRSYYETLLNLPQAYISAQRGSLAGTSDDAQRELAELSVLLRFLTVPDSAWTPEQLEYLPEWLRQAGPCTQLEEFALRLSRPVTAMSLAESQRKQAWDEPQRVQYLEAIAKVLENEGEFPASLCMYREAIARVRALRDDATDARLSLELAESYFRLKQPLLGAAVLEEAMRACPTSPRWGELLFERFRQLYQADSHQAILEDFARYRDDPRVQSYEAPLHYIAWITNQKIGQNEAAGKLYREFVEKYPNNVLCADMIFAEAMSELSGGNYAAAEKLLDRIEYRYPDSSMIGKVRSIRQRLAGGRKPPSPNPISY